MSTDLYKVAPGDLITAKLFNGLQDKVKQDTTKQIDDAIKAITKVPQAGDSEKFGGKSLDELEKKIIDRVLGEIQKRSGYKMIFKRLEVNKPEVVNHDLKAFPLVDVYQLDYFEVVCADDEEKDNKFVNFFLYHSDETEQRAAGTGPRRKIIIESSEEGQFVFKIRFDKMLEMMGVEYTPSQSVGDVVTEFWQALFTKPNDRFDVDQYCNSIWFEKCCGENRAMSTLHGRDNIDELWFQMRARKTINFPYPVKVPADPLDSLPVFPNNVEIVHLDFDNIGINLLQAPFYPKSLQDPDTSEWKINEKELKVMLLLKV